jgi:hypothetical protein
MKPRSTPQIIGITDLMGSPTAKKQATAQKPAGAAASHEIFMENVTTNAKIKNSNDVTIKLAFIAVRTEAVMKAKSVPQIMGNIAFSMASLLAPSKMKSAQPTRQGQVNKPKVPDIHVQIPTNIPIDNDKGNNCIVILLLLYKIWQLYPASIVY